jgi:hypothetical protein
VPFMILYFPDVASLVFLSRLAQAELHAGLALNVSCTR